MTIKLNFISFFITLLILGYLLFNRNPLYALIQRKVIPPEAGLYKKQVLDQYLAYWSGNIIDKGFFRLKVQGERKSTVVTKDSLESIIKISLPKGFKHGILRFYTNANSEFLVEVSPDQKNWKTTSYPGYTEASANILNLSKKDSDNNAVFIKFTTLNNQLLQFSFDEFLLVSDLPSDTKDYSHYLLFFPDVDVDYDGRIINRPGMLYEEYVLKKNLTK